MAEPFNSRHIVITGGSSGIGAALARQLAPFHCHLTLIGRDAGRLNGVRAECVAAGSSCVAYSVDVTDSRAIASCLAEAQASAPVDMVIANAGIGGKAVLAPATGETAEHARQIFEANTMGVINSVTPLLAGFRERGRGQIVIVSSIMAYHGLPDAPVYSASKAAVRIYGQGLRRLLAPAGVKVLVVCPGFIETPMNVDLPMKMPFSLTAEAAAARILTAVSNGKSEIAFPWQWRTVAFGASIMPSFMVDSLFQICRNALKRDF
ncbi:MAG: SDR family NAD(P)-dependent oxidoreductase [Alphaproteobacteria bacterium]|nr:SDR family NAD(P)-dependent oxidoreductase [Alphaproteobacteria bacterium]